MKISGQTPGLCRGRFTLTRADPSDPDASGRKGGRAWELTLQALPYGFPERNQRDLPFPPPPVEFARGPGGAVLRDSEDRAIRTANTDDPAWQAQVAHVRELRTLNAFVMALSVDSTIELDSKREKFRSASDWLEAVASEVAAAGITDTEITEVLAVVHDLNRGRARSTEQGAVTDFLSSTPSARAGDSPTAPAAPEST